jgi:hypothetical protein
MISNLDLKDNVKEGVNYGFIITSFILGGISLGHICTALIQGVRGKGRGN